MFPFTQFLAVGGEVTIGHCSIAGRILKAFLLRNAAFSYVMSLNVHNTLNEISLHNECLLAHQEMHTADLSVQCATYG